MVATLTMRVYTGTNAATESAAVSGIDLISADNATNTLANRAAYPVAPSAPSMTKHIRLHIDSAPVGAVSAFKYWMSTTKPAGGDIMSQPYGAGGASPGTGDFTPTTAGIATATSAKSAYTYTSASKGTWDATGYSAVNAVTVALHLQLQVGWFMVAGGIAQQVMNFQYDET